MGLEEQHCVPCKQGGSPIAKAEAVDKLLQVPGWELSEDGRRIFRHYIFKNFKEALAFVNQIASIAEEQRHHPDITLGWGYVTLSLQTHSVGGLHDNDFILAAKINRISV